MNNRIDKKQELIYLKIRRMILLLILLVGLLVMIVAAVFIDVPHFLVGVLVAVFIVIIMFRYLYLGMHYQHFRYTMNTEGLYIQSGAFWRTQTFVPRNRVQHTDITQGPLERKYKLATFIVHTAGTRNAVTKLPGIFKQDAELMRESLLFDNNDAV